LITIGWRSGKQHKIEIWFVEYDSKYYVISEHHERAHWVQNIIHNPKVSFAVDNNNTFEGSARLVNRDKDPELAAIVSKLMNTKYGWSNGLIVQLVSH
jgi:hypothetical protein